MKKTKNLRMKGRGKSEKLGESDRGKKSEVFWE